MLFISMLETLIDRNEHNDSGGYKGKYDVEIDRFAVYKQHVTEDAPQKSDAYGLTICNLSACHSLHLFSLMKQASRNK